MIPGWIWLSNPNTFSDPQDQATILQPSIFGTKVAGQFNPLGVVNVGDGAFFRDDTQKPVLNAALWAAALTLRAPNSATNAPSLVRPSVVYNVRAAEIQAMQNRLLGAP